ncbi:sporulation protein [Spirillospora sp. NPDC050679]
MAGGYGGGPTVETILSEPHCRPGGVVAGKVHLRGGARAAEIRHVTLALMPRMRDAHGGPETAGPEVYRGALTRAFRLEAGQQRDLPFSIPLPYELPFTTVLGRELPGFTIGLCTEVDVMGSPDPGDVDPISVEPLQSQQWVLAAIARLGFKIQNVTFQRSKLRGVPQQLPFHQEIHLKPPPRFQGRLDRVGLTFAATPRVMAFKLRAEDRADDDPSFGAFQVGHPETAETDWNTKIDQWLEAAALLPRSASHRSGGSPYRSGGSPLPPPGGAPLPPPGGAPLPPPGSQTPPPGQGGYPPPPGQHNTPMAPAAYGGGQYPPPAPAPGQQAPMPGHGTVPPPGVPYGHTAPPPPSYPPPPGHHAPQNYQAPPSHGAPAYPPPPGHGQHHAPPPGYNVHHHPGGHHGPGWGGAAAAAGIVGGAAAAGIAGGMAVHGAADAVGAVGAVGGAAVNAAGFAQNVAGYPAAQFGEQMVNQAGQAAMGFAGDQVRGYVGEQAGQWAADAAANGFGEAAAGAAGDVAGEVAGGIAEALGGLLGGLFG